MTPEQVEKLLAELAEQEYDCRPHAYDDESQSYLEWAIDQERQAAASAAYRHAQRLIREITRTEVRAA